jgi:DUF438 domain-containing protein
MSNLINNREYRREVLKEMIGELHAGKSVEEVKRKFEETFEGVSASEISEVEQALIADGMPVSEVQRLCDVHAAVFKGSIEEIHRPQDLAGEPGHPAATLKAENRAIERLIATRVKPHLARFAEKDGAEARDELMRDLGLLAQVDIHYARKENLMFPYLEKYGVTAPPKVMWGVDDEIRSLVKKAKEALESGDRARTKAAAEEAVHRIAEMIFKEENILLPMLMDKLTQDEWRRIYRDSGEIGYCLLEGAPVWSAAERAADAEAEKGAADGALSLPSGELKLDEIVGMLDALPFDITFVDKDDTVKYFSQGKDRIFVRTKAVIGRKVANCHPPASVHIVEKLLSDFRSGAKDHEDFWIRMGEKFVLIRYYAVRGAAGEYLGTLEVTQDIAPIQAIQGVKRLLSE